MTTIGGTPLFTESHPLDDGVLLPHYSMVERGPWDERWPNFPPKELACRRDGSLYIHTRTNDAIQQARYWKKGPIHLNSAHRSWLNNLAAGGAPRSAHLWIALDVSTRGQDRLEIYLLLRKAGFRSFGYYETFIHADLRPGRRWFASKRAKAIWQPLLKQIEPIT